MIVNRNKFGIITYYATRLVSALDDLKWKTQNFESSFDDLDQTVYDIYKKSIKLS